MSAGGAGSKWPTFTRLVARCPPRGDPPTAVIAERFNRGEEVDPVEPTLTALVVLIMIVIFDNYPKQDASQKYDYLVEQLPSNIGHIFSGSNMMRDKLAKKYPQSGTGPSRMLVGYGSNESRFK